MRKAAFLLLLAAKVFAADKCAFQAPLAQFFCVEAPKELTARINASVPQGSSLFVYVPRTSSALPGNAIPADTDVLPLLVKDGRITAIAPRVNVPTGKEATVTFAPPRAGHVDVVLPLFIAPKSDPSVQPPQILIGENEKPLVGLSKGTTAPALLFFRDVAAPAKLKISGKRWKTIEAPIGNGPVVMLDPITAVQTSKVVVNWWAPIDPATLVTRNGECTISKRAFRIFMEPRSSEPKFVGILASCSADPSRPGSRTACKEVAKRELPRDPIRGSFEFEDVPAGNYTIELDYPGLPRVAKGFEIAARETTPVDLPLTYITFFGRVTRGTKPVHAMVFGAVSDPDTGAYEAVVTRLPAAKSIAEVLPCDGADPYRFIPDEGPKENTAFDIVVPDNRLTVEVYDNASGAPVANASVGFGALVSGEKLVAHFNSKAGDTDENGRLTISPVLQNRLVKICASREDYEGPCYPDFKMEESDKTVRIGLTRVQVKRGRVNAPGFTRGMLAWYSPATGNPTEMIYEFKEAGSFVYRKDHRTDEIVIFTAVDRPLYAFRQPLLRSDEIFDITFPLAPVRSFTVTLAESSKEQRADVALSIGDVIVPVDVVGNHLIGRRIQPSIRPGGSVLIPEILETGPIRVILVPSSAVGRYKDVALPLVPEIGSFPTQDLGTHTEVVFP